MSIVPACDKTVSLELQLVCLLIGRITVNLLQGYIFFFNKDTFVLIRHTSLHAAEAVSEKEWWNLVHDVIYTNVFHITVVSLTWKSKFPCVFIS